MTPTSHSAGPPLRWFGWQKIAAVVAILAIVFVLCGGHTADWNAIAHKAIAKIGRSA